MFVPQSTGKDTWNSALLAAGGVLDAVEHVLNGNIEHVFCNIRPPGHHAYADKGGGFCIFNNIALGAEKASHYFDRVLIFDWDVHHGNGTEAIFKNRKDVLFGSIHRSPPFYPNTGSSLDNDKNNKNYPLEAFVSVENYKKVFENFFKTVQQFSPDIIFISCGIDSHKDDIIGGDFQLTEYDYAWMIKKFKTLKKPIVCALEGGYNTKALSDSAREIVKELMKKN
jgi:acetoin utilization deacetylase AcuC-like enzyme